MEENSISEKMLPPEAQLLAVARFRCLRRNIVDLIVHKSLKNNSLPSLPPDSPQVLSSKFLTSQQEPDDRWNGVPRLVRCWAGRGLCGSALAWCHRSGLLPRARSDIPIWRQIHITGT